MSGPSFNSFFQDDDEHHNKLPPNNLSNPNPNTSADHSYSPFHFNSPTPTHYNTLLFSDDEFSLTHFLPHHQDGPQQKEQSPPPVSKDEREAVVEVEVVEARPQRRRAAGKADRHSKIYTAQGARDRRMRLSLPIARRFFDLQDVLGFDKASKTIEWLFRQSKSAINGLDISLPFDVPAVGRSGGEVRREKKKKKKRSSAAGKKGSRRGSSGSSGGGCVINDPAAAREARDKARARARERTREKMMMVTMMAAAANGQNPSYSSCYSSITNEIHQNPRAPLSSVPQDQQVRCSWNECSNNGCRALQVLLAFKKA